MRFLQTLLNEAFKEDIARRMYPPEKVQARLLMTTPNPNGVKQDDFFIGTALKIRNIGSGEEFGGHGTTNKDRIRRADPEIVWKLVFDMIADIDPTPQKKYAPWVMRSWMTIDKHGYPGFTFEDSGRVTMCLDFLERHKKDGALVRAAKVMREREWNQLMAEFLASNFDINKLTNLYQLEVVTSAISEVIEADPAVQLSRRKAAEAMDGSFFSEGKANLCLDTKTTKIVQPLTKDASCHFGVNTRWCTAATKGRNMFNEYAGYGDLYIILDKPRNKRWQIYFPYTGDRGGPYDDEEDYDAAVEPPGFQFMNENDEPASLVDLPDEAFDWLRPHLLTYHHDEGPEYMKILHEVMAFKNKILYDMFVWDAFGRLERPDTPKSTLVPGRVISQRPGRFRLLYETMTPEIEAFLKKHWPKGYENFVEGVQMCRLVKPEPFNKSFAAIWMFNSTYGTGDPRTLKNWDKTKPPELPFYFSQGKWREVNSIEGIGMPSHSANQRAHVGHATTYGIYLDTPYEYHTYDHKQRNLVKDDATKTSWSQTGMQFSNAYWAISSKYNMKYVCTFYEIDDAGGVNLVKTLPPPEKKPE